MNEIIKYILIFLLIITGIIIVSICIYNYNLNHPCVEYKTICLKSETSLMPVPMGKTIAILPVTNYHEVSCSSEYDTAERKCVRKK